jgi:hypothetical protein
MGSKETAMVFTSAKISCFLIFILRQKKGKDNSIFFRDLHPGKAYFQNLLSRNVTLQSRVAYGKSSCGLGVRAVRAGSTGRDGQRLGDRDEYPPEGAGGLGPRPLRGEITA